MLSYAFLGEALNNSELLARSRELQLVELAVGHYLRFADQCASASAFLSPLVKASILKIRFIGGSLTSSSTTLQRV